MVEAEAATHEKTDAGDDVARIYELGYIIVPTAKEDDVEKILGSIRAEVEKAGGNFIAEGAPSMTRLSYTIPALEGGKRVEHDRGYFGWLKFEIQVAAARTLERMLAQNEKVMRSILFRTVREDTRAKMKAPTLREVKRTDTIQARPRRVEESAGPVSEADLEKALQDITTE